MQIERDSLRLKKRKTYSDTRKFEDINHKLNRLSKQKSDLYIDLPKRIVETNEDCRIILNSKSLRPFLIQNSTLFYSEVHDGDYENYRLLTSLGEIGRKQWIEYDGTEPIPDFSKWKIHQVKNGKTRRYWLSTSETPKATSKDFTKPEYAITGIKGTWNIVTKIKLNELVGRKKIIEKIDVREILREAVDLEKRYQGYIKNKKYPQILPRKKKQAIDVIRIKEKILKFKKKKSQI